MSFSPPKTSSSYGLLFLNYMNQTTRAYWLSFFERGRRRKLMCPSQSLSSSPAFLGSPAWLSALLDAST